MEKFKKVSNKTEMSIENTQKPPVTAEQQVNCYGTYEIQPTADREDMYPAIAQGFNEKIIKTDRENEERRDEAQKSGKKRD
ncbi:MAG: hypothetical protein J6C27_06315 [Clostridia bacterium]|nr:hypothetical protein [Clostridia bacterium]